jgi:hypothetical protein
MAERALSRVSLGLLNSADCFHSAEISATVSAGRPTAAGQFETTNGSNAVRIQPVGATH